MTPTITAAANGWIVTTADGVQHVATAEMVVSAATAKASEYEVCLATQGDGDREEVKGEAEAWKAWAAASFGYPAWRPSVINFEHTTKAFRAALRIAIAANKSDPRRITEADLHRIALAAVDGIAGLRRAMQYLGIPIE